MIYFMCVGVLSMSMLVYHVSTCHQQRSEGGTRFPATGVMKGYELPGGCWEPNLSSDLCKINKCS